MWAPVGYEVKLVFEKMEIVSELGRFFELVAPWGNFKICTIDQLRRVRIIEGESYGILINLAPSVLPLSHHWCSIFIDTSLNASYFDTMGYGGHYLCKRWMRRNTRTFSCTPIRVQPNVTNLSAMYAACFAQHMIRGGNKHEFYYKFTLTNLYANDYIINSYYERKILRLKRHELKQNRNLSEMDKKLLSEMKIVRREMIAERRKMRKNLKLDEKKLKRNEMRTKFILKKRFYKSGLDFLYA